MTVKIVFFANLREALGVDSVDLQISGSCSVSALISQLADRQSPEWLDMLTAENTHSEYRKCYGIDDKLKCQREGTIGLISHEPASLKPDFGRAPWNVDMELR